MQPLLIAIFTQFLTFLVRAFPKIAFLVLLSLVLAVSCREGKKAVEKPRQRIFEGYHILLDEIIRSKLGVFRGVDLNSNSQQIKALEGVEPVEESPDHLYFEFKADSLTDYSIDYTLDNDSLEEITIQINSNDLELTSYLFCDIKDYYANKLPNPTEDKGYVVYNCFEGQRKPFVVSLSDNSSPSKGIINMVIYKDK